MDEEMSRSDTSQSDERPLWETPARVFGFSSIRTAECADEERPVGLRGCPSHILLGTEDLLHSAVHKCLDAAGDVLGIRAEDAWRWQRPFFDSLLRMFFDPASDGPAWIAIIPFRMAYEHRFTDRSIITDEVVKQPSLVASARRLESVGLELGYGLGEIQTSRLLWGYGSGGEDRPYLLRQERNRMLSGCVYGESLDTLLYLAHPDADGEFIQRGQIPEIARHFDAHLGLQKTASVTLAKLSRSSPGSVTQLIATIRPHDGRTVGLAPGRRSFRTYMLQYPIDRRLVTRAVSRA